MMVERKELERNLGRTFIGFKFNIHMTNSHVRSIISSRFELIEALYTVDYLIMHSLKIAICITRMGKSREIVGLAM